MKKLLAVGLCALTLVVATGCDLTSSLLPWLEAIDTISAVGGL